MSNTPARRPRERAKTKKKTPPNEQLMRITVRDEVLELSGNISLAEKMAVRSATGIPLDAFWSGEDRIGEDSFCVLWWLARRANGAAGLPWAQHVAEWPSGISVDEVNLELIDGDDEEAENPEG